MPRRRPPTEPLPVTGADSVAKPVRPRPPGKPPPLPAADDGNLFDPFGDEASTITGESGEAADKAPAQMLNQLQSASAGLRELQETRANDLKEHEGDDRHNSAAVLMVKDAEGRVVSEAVKSLTQNMTEEMTAKEMDDFISGLPVEQLFKTFDLDGSGAIDFDEFSKMLPQLNIYLSEAQALKFFANIDQDGSGEIDQEGSCSNVLFLVQFFCPFFF